MLSNLARSRDLGLSAPALLLCATALFVSPACAAPALTYQAWDSSQTGLFFQGLANPTLSCWSSCAGNVTWVGNNLSLEYRREYGGAAWASTKSNNAFDHSQDLPSPANAVGIAFEVSENYYQAAWAVLLDLGTYENGYVASDTLVNLGNPQWTQVTGGGSGGIPRGNSQFEPLVWSFFPEFDYNYSNGVWSVEMFYPDQWLFDRANLAQRFSFFATNTFGGPSQLVDGVTRFENVRWILTDQFPSPPPCDTCNGQPPAGTAPEPGTCALVAAASLGLAITRRRSPTLKSLSAAFGSLSAQR